MIQGALRDGRRRASKARSTRFSFLCTRPSTWTQRTFANTAIQEARPSGSRSSKKARGHRFDEVHARSPKAVLNDVYIGKCTAGLDARLPPHIRASEDYSHGAATKQAFEPDAVGIAEFLLATENDVDRSESPEHLDLLYRLAVEQGRWKVVVWLTRTILETFHGGVFNNDSLSQMTKLWNRSETLEEATDAPLYRKPGPHGNPDSPHIQYLEGLSLDALTSNANATPVEMLWHDILGLIWRSLGRMTIACASQSDIAGGGMKPEVLEMIALLHHHEFMPSSIYSQLPSENDDAIQQPPTLNILSSRILTALSDATWRAREASSAEEAKRKGGLYQALHTRIPGMFSRKQAPGVKPEIWLELILWSSLHGGWIAWGADVLRYVCLEQGEAQWIPLSWRDSLRNAMPFGHTKLLDWDSIKRLFDASDANTDNARVAGLRIDKTVSSEVVNAYVDALLNSVHMPTGVNSRRTGYISSLHYIRRFREFLGRANLNLGGGTWDAIVFRLLESAGTHIDHRPRTIDKFVELIPRIGQELASPQSASLPSYVLDGSAAIFGLLHRTLRSYIASGNLHGACKAYSTLQARVDDDRRSSIADFFANQRLHAALIDASTDDVFTGNLSGIDHPSFDYLLPPETAAAFLNLATDSEDYDLGTSMLYRADLDGPMIPESSYHNPQVSAAIIKFATATNNTELISRIVAVQSHDHEAGKQKFPRDVLQEFLNVQIKLRKWDAAIRILNYMRDTRPYYAWGNFNGANLATQMMLSAQEDNAKEPGSDFASSSGLFKALYSGNFDVKDHVISLSHNSTVLPIVLAVADKESQDFCEQARLIPDHCPFDLPVGCFNALLKTVGEVHGARVAAQLVSTFWRREAWLPARLKRYGNDLSELDADHWTLPRVPKSDQDDQTTRHRFCIQGLGSRTAVSESLAPNNSTFRVIFRCALEEYTRQPVKTTDVQGISALANSRESEEVTAETPKLSANHLPLASRATLLYTKGTGKEVLDTFVWTLLSLRRAGFGILDDNEQLTDVLTSQDRAAVTQVVGDEEAHEYSLTYGNTDAAPSAVATREPVDKTEDKAVGLGSDARQDSDEEAVRLATESSPDKVPRSMGRVPVEEKRPAWYEPKPRTGARSTRVKRWYRPVP